MRQSLNTIVGNCASTLEDLQKILDKYKEYLPDPSTTNVPQPQGKIGIVRKGLARNLKRLKWAGKGNELNEFRVRLQNHTGAINTILNTATWYVFLSTSVMDGSCS
jgi:hypothetical protein